MYPTDGIPIYRYEKYDLPRRPALVCLLIELVEYLVEGILDLTDILAVFSFMDILGQDPLFQAIVISLELLDITHRPFQYPCDRADHKEVDETEDNAEEGSDA